MRAYVRGWREYLTGDPSPAHAALKRANPNNTDEFMAFSRKMIIDEKLVTGRGAKGDESEIGQLDKSRYENQIRQLEDLKILKPGKITAASVLSVEYQR